MKIEKATYDPKIDAVPDINPAEQVSRERWAEAAGVVMARTMAPIVLHTIVLQGFSEFERKYRPIAKAQGFRQENVRRIFEIITSTAAANPIDGRPNIERL